MDKALELLVAEDIMSRDVVAVSPHDTVQEALTLIQENSLSTLPVTNNHGKIVGVISAKDILQWAEGLDAGIAEMMEISPFYRDWIVSEAGEESQSVKVSELMSDRVVTASVRCSLAEVVSMMLRNQIHHLPVHDSAEKMIGIVSTSDVLRALADSLATSSAT